MTFLLALLISLLPVLSFAQSAVTMWPVPQRDGNIVYVPMGTGNPPLWATPDGRGSVNMIPNGVGTAPSQGLIFHHDSIPPLSVPRPMFQPSTRELSDDREEAFRSLYGR